jgi:hypothetical protein
MATPSSCIQLALEETPRYENAAATTPYRVGTDVAYLPITSCALSPGPSWIDRSDEIRAIEGGVPQLIDTYDVTGNIAIRNYLNALPWLLVCAGFTATLTAGGATVADPDTTTATGVNGLNSTSINAADTSLFSASGNALLAGVSFTYTGKTATSFTGCGNHAATTGGEIIAGNIPTGVSKWVFTKRSGVQARTMQVLQNFVDAQTAGNSLFVKGQGVGVSGLSLNSGGEVSADLMGLVYLTQSDPNLTPAYDTQAIPFGRRGDMTLTWLANSATFDDFSLAIANSLIKHRSMGVASYFPDTISQGDDRVRITGSAPKYNTASADIAAELAGTTFAAKARWKLPKVVGATTYAYSMWFEMPSCQYTGGGPDAVTNARRRGSSFDFWAAWDETAGYDCRITIANALTSMGNPFNATNVGV